MFGRDIPIHLGQRVLDDQLAAGRVERAGIDAIETLRQALRLRHFGCGDRRNRARIAAHNSNVRRRARTFELFIADIEEQLVLMIGPPSVKPLVDSSNEGASEYVSVERE